MQSGTDPLYTPSSQMSNEVVGVSWYPSAHDIVTISPCWLEPESSPLIGACNTEQSSVQSNQMNQNNNIYHSVFFKNKKLK